MNLEKNIIEQILKNFAKCPQHQNNFFESDSEIIKLGDSNYLITVDSYSNEDNFRRGNPYLLGSNLTVCTLSDIFACGGRPILFCNSLAYEKTWDENYIDQFAKGINSVLEQCYTGFIGGDIGLSHRWSYTGVAIGTGDKIITRKGASEGDSIYITGDIGRGNFEAATNIITDFKSLNELYNITPIAFPIRLNEAQLVSKYASSCIDTSDGLMRSLRIISEINQTGFEINDIPYFEAGILLTQMLELPKEMLMIGESGEYELLFTVPRKSESKMIKEAFTNKLQIKRIGSVKTEGIQALLNNGIKIDISDFDIWARNYNEHLDYIKDLSKYISNKMGVCK